MKIKKGDKVIVRKGSDKGKIGEVLKSLKSENKVIIEGVNMKKYCVKATKEKEGSFEKKEFPVDVSNVLIYDEKTKKGSRIGFVVENGKKSRVSKKTNTKLK